MCSESPLEHNYLPAGKQFYPRGLFGANCYTFIKYVRVRTCLPTQREVKIN